MAFAPTAEQQTAIDLARTGARLAIEAGAGCGKTSCLKFVAEDRPGTRMLYLAFNKAIATDASQKFPSNVTCKTVHGLAYGPVGSKFRGRLNGPRVRNTDIARMLKLQPLTVTVADGGKRTLAAGFLAGQVMAAVRSFCQSGADRIGPSFLPSLPLTGDPLIDRAIRADVVAQLAPVLAAAWADIESPSGTLPFSHDCYLKLFQLARPNLGADVILLDEAQDSNGVTLALVQDQDAQVVIIGDRQQSIYGWRGAMNAMETVEVDERAWLTESFRFGPEVAEVANVALEELDAELRIIGSGKPGEVAPLDRADVTLCRTNAKAVELALGAIDAGQRAAVVGGATEVVKFAEAAEQLQRDGRTEHPDLMLFASWGQVQEYADEDGGQDLKVLVRLVDKFGADRIRTGLSRTVDEKHADVIFATAHKSKGREWESVALAGDFPVEKEDEDGNLLALADEEWRLIYVAATRAMGALDPYACAPLAARLAPPVLAPDSAALLSQWPEMPRETIALVPEIADDETDEVDDAPATLFPVEPGDGEAAKAIEPAATGSADLHPKAIELAGWLAAHPTAPMADAMAAFGWTSPNTLGGYLVSLIDAGLLDLRVLAAAAA